MTDAAERCCFDDWVGFYAKRARRGRLGRPSRDLIAGLSQTGLDGRTVLDVGCSVGGLLFATLERGATAASGVDLSGAAIGEARRIAVERGESDRATFEVRDGASAHLVPHDVVVLDKVFCCYRNMDGLLANSLGAARSVYAFSAPPNAGLRGVMCRVLTAISNRWYRLRRRRFGGFQAYVHDLDAVDRRIRAAGFERLFARRRLAWDVAVYARS